MGKLVDSADASTQFLTAVEDALEPPKNLKVFLAKREKLHKVNPLIEKLTGLKNEIGNSANTSRPSSVGPSTQQTKPTSPTTTGGNLKST